MNNLTLQHPSVLLPGLLGTCAVLTPFVRLLLRRGIPRRRVVMLTGLRMTVFLMLILLVARPVWTESENTQNPNKRVVLLVDRSQSMSLREGDEMRYHRAIDFARDSLLPVLDSADIAVVPLLFAEDVETASGPQIAESKPSGMQTNLSRAIVHSIVTEDLPPLAVVALTDGAVTQDSDNSRAVSALLTHGVPFVGIGFGSENDSRMLSLEQVVAPAIVSPEQRFQVAARLRSTGATMPSFDLLLMKDGQLVKRRTIPGYTGARNWQESFDVVESIEGIHSWTVQLMPPQDPDIVSTRTESSDTVRVVADGDLRVLYLQGGLTWDYKFIHIALRSDPTIKLAGLSRTASTSKFFENVQNDIDLVDGFPSTIEKLTEFRVVVLSNLKPRDLTPHQQELLARFCGEFGGGVLMIGGPNTFNASWKDSRVEELLPVRFAAQSVAASNSPIRLLLTEPSLTHPVFRISDSANTQGAWSNLPTFTNYATVDAVKPGAQVWLEHSRPAGSRPPVVMASQQFGNGISSVICMQNFWRWRLAKQSDTDHFDRFWQQLFRFLGETGHERIGLTLRDQQLIPGETVQLTVERRADARQQNSERLSFLVRVTDSDGHEVVQEQIQLGPGQNRDVTFPADAAGTFTAIVEDQSKSVMASRTIEISDVSSEYVSTARNMDTLRQWAAVSSGVAVAAEDCSDIAALLNPYLDPNETRSHDIQRSVPAGVNAWTMLLLVGCQCVEWLCRKRWGMT